MLFPCNDCIGAVSLGDVGLQDSCMHARKRNMHTLLHRIVHNVNVGLAAASESDMISQFELQCVCLCQYAGNESWCFLHFDAINFACKRAWRVQMNSIVAKARLKSHTSDAIQ